jgi:hypothetical protein
LIRIELPPGSPPSPGRRPFTDEWRIDNRTLGGQPRKGDDGLLETAEAKCCAF